MLTARPLAIVAVLGVLASTSVAVPLVAQSRPPRAATSAPAGITAGSYLVGIVSLGDTTWLSWTLRVAGDSVFASPAPGAPEYRGTLRSTAFVLQQYWDSTAVRARFEAVAENGRLTGRALGTRRGNPAFVDTATWFATRRTERVGAARTVRFDPTTFVRTFSPAHAPALRIFPGDTVETRTVDAGGVDWDGKQRTAGGNPQTGPFYVEGAMPGDVIAIHLHRVRLNRDFANAGTSLVGSAITTGLARGLPDVPNFSGRWTLDRTAGVARLATPTPALAGYTVPLRPMLGCIAVAPVRGQAIRTQDSGPFGGNMDFNALVEGTTVYLTVNVPGALVFVGDGHAAQGDGELTGDALETSMDVAFSVELLRGRDIGGPRAESPEFLMSIGIAGDLQEALRNATADMTRWLARDYGLNSAELASLLGTGMRYDVADMVGTQVSIVAKMPKALLAPLRKPSGGR
jgi:acetamidase/formamidase